MSIYRCINTFQLKNRLTFTFLIKVIKQQLKPILVRSDISTYNLQFRLYLIKFVLRILKNIPQSIPLFFQTCKQRIHNTFVIIIMFTTSANRTRLAFFQFISKSLSPIFNHVFLLLELHIIPLKIDFCKI